MRRDSGSFVRYAGTALLAALFGVPVLLLVTTSWPHIVIGGATIAFLSYAFGMYRTGYEAGYRARDELAYEHAIEAVRFATSDHSEGM